MDGFIIISAIFLLSSYFLHIFHFFLIFSGFFHCLRSEESKPNAKYKMTKILSSNIIPKHTKRENVILQTVKLFAFSVSGFHGSNLMNYPCEFPRSGISLFAPLAIKIPFGKNKSQWMAQKWHQQLVDQATYLRKSF